MARGDARKFDAVPGFLAEQKIDIKNGAWKVALLSAGFDVVLAAESNPRLNQGNLTEVTAGGGYAAGGIAVTLANTDAAGVYTMKLDTGVHADGKIAWSKAAGSPTDIKTALLYQDDAANNEAAFAWDLTTDGGGTPVSLVAGDVTVEFATGPGEIGDLT